MGYGCVHWTHLKYQSVPIRFVPAALARWATVPRTGGVRYVFVRRPFGVLSGQVIAGFKGSVMILPAVYQTDGKGFAILGISRLLFRLVV